MHSYNPPPDTGLDILYLDPYLIALNKPSGLLSVPGRGQDRLDCLVYRVQQEYPEALVVHRLDMATSGIILMARDKTTQRQLGRLFEQRKISKTYIAIIQGRPNTDAGQIDLPLICDWPNRPRQMVDHQQGKQASTLFRMLEYLAENNTSRIELSPQTGRSHQLRVHMQALGHPILGDELYGEESPNPPGRLMLHATELGFTHPMEHKHVKLTCATPF